MAKIGRRKWLALGALAFLPRSAEAQEKKDLWSEWEKMEWDKAPWGRATMRDPAWGRDVKDIYASQDPRPFAIVSSAAKVQAQFDEYREARVKDLRDLVQLLASNEAMRAVDAKLTVKETNRELFLTTLLKHLIAAHKPAEPPAKNP